jgi:ankyrin repeat protein/beta-lactamase regulating signal transducer with metallopeptidase domain
MNAYLIQVVDYLLSQSWQIALLTVVVALITFLLRHKSAHVRYLLWLIILAKCLVPPLYTVPVTVLPQDLFGAGPSGSEPTKTRAESQTVAVSTSDLSSTGTKSANVQVLPFTESAVAMGVTDASKWTWAAVRIWLGIIWLVGVGVYLAVNVLKAMGTRRWLQRERRPLEPELQMKVSEFFGTHGIKRLPKIWAVEEVSQPFVWGLVRGSIYIPADLLSADSLEQQRNVLAHELSHTMRYDAMVSLLQVIAQTIFWFHPLVWWINLWIRREREKCCDEMAVASLNTPPKDYTRAIVEALATGRRSAHPNPSLAIVGSVKDIEKRIKTMLRPGKKFYKRPSIIVLTTIFLLSLFIVPIGCALTNKSETKIATKQAEKSSISLFEAIWDGDSEEVKRLISNGADVNKTDPNKPNIKFTPLMAAANGGFAEVAKVLLENGAEVNATDFQGWTALYYAFWLYSYDDNEEKHRERAELVKALVAGGADVNKKVQGISPLINAITTGTPRLGSIEALLDAGADLEFKDNRGLTPLYYAAFVGDREVLDLVLERGDFPDTIYLAACRGDLDRVRTLLEEGADVNAKDEFGCTPLHWAARARSPEVARLLIKNGANVDAASGPDALTPFMAARQLPIIEFLISAGADIRSQENLSKLHDACSVGDIELIKFLIDKGADINARNNRGATPLCAAAGGDHQKVVELLLDEGADINTRGRRGATPLWTAVRNFSKETAEFLIEKGANINTPDDRGVTPLDVAEQRGSTDMVELLQQHGAIKGSPNLLGIINSGDIEQVKLLISQGADINVKNSNGLTPLYLASQEGRKDVVELLIDNGADINAKNNNGITPLHRAAREGHKDVVELLISRGADINVKNTRGQTPLDLAQQRGHTEIVELLKNHGAKE